MTSPMRPWPTGSALGFGTTLIGSSEKGPSRPSETDRSGSVSSSQRSSLGFRCAGRASSAVHAHGCNFATDPVLREISWLAIGSVKLSLVSWWFRADHHHLHQSAG
jgi:hypothetical protein